MTDLPHKNGNFRFPLIDFCSESSQVADPVANLPHKNGNFRFLLIDSCSRELICGRSGDKSTHLEMVILDSYL